MRLYLNAGYRIVFSVMLLCMSSRGYSQQMGVHGMGEKCLSAAIGLSPVSRVLHGDVAYFFNDKFFVKGILSYEWGKPHQVKYATVSGGGQFFYSLFHINHTVFINTGIGPVASYDRLEIVDEKLINYGGMGTVEMEAYLSYRMAILASVNQAFMFKEGLKGARVDFSVGLRFCL